MAAPEAPHGDGALRDGRLVTLTPLRTQDEAELAPLREAAGDPHRAATAPARGERRAGALVARTPDGELAGYAAWSQGDGGDARLVGAVTPRFQGLGLGTLLVRRAAADAHGAGLRTLRVELPPGSAAIAEMLRDCGLRAQWDLDYPVAHVDLALDTRRPGWVTP